MRAPKRMSVLVVDDERENLDLVSRALRNDFTVHLASSGSDALRLMSHTPVDIIVTDQRMPEMTGIELLREAAQRRPDIKRILVTAFTDTESVVQAINTGKIHYYLRKPWNDAELQETLTELAARRRLEEENAELLEELRKKNNELAIRESLLQESLDARGRELLATVDRLNSANLELSKLVYRDGLTGLYNHRCLQERMREEIARSLRYERPLSLIFMDVDHFKDFNDRYGHPLGDEALKALGRILLGAGQAEGTSRKSDVAARYGGEELVLLLPETSRSGALVKAERLREAASQVRFTSHPEARLTLSAGVAECPADATSVEALIARADEALYRAKNQGRNRVVCCGPDRGLPA